MAAVLLAYGIALNLLEACQAKSTIVIWRDGGPHRREQTFHIAGNFSCAMKSFSGEPG
jgi:hypothetical protein